MFKQAGLRGQYLQRQTGLLKNDHPGKQYPEKNRPETVGCLRHCHVRPVTDSLFSRIFSMLIYVAGAAGRRER